MAIRPMSEVEWIRLSLVTERARFMPTWRVEHEFVNPHYIRESSGGRNDGSRKSGKIINNLARRGLRVFQSGMFNGATPRQSPWFFLTVPNDELANRQDAKRYFYKAERVLNQHFELSNLYQVLPMSYKNLGTCSNSAFAMLPHQKYGFFFQPFITGSWGVGRNVEGDADIFFRDFTMTVKQVVESYGRLNSRGHIEWSNQWNTIDPWIQDAWNEGRYTETVMLTNVIIPNPNPDKYSIDPADKAWQSYTYIMAMGGGLPNQYAPGQTKFQGKRPVELSLPTEREQYLSVKGYDYFPVIVPGWDIPPENDYGVDGPCEIAIDDVMTLQELAKGRLTAVDKLLRPPMVGPSSLRRHQSSILAGGITYIEGESAKFVPAFEVDPKVAELINAEDKYEQAVNNAFYVDVFLRILTEKKISHVSAREIEEKAQEKLTTLGPLLGQVDRNQSSKIIDNAQILLSAQGRMPEPPESLIGQNMRPEYISPLARAAKQLMITGAERSVNFGVSLANATQNPALARIFKTEKIVRDYSFWNGLDPHSIADENEYQEILQQVAQEQAQAKQLAQAQVRAQTAKDLSQAEISPDKNMLQLAQEAG